MDYQDIFNRVWAYHETQENKSTVRLDGMDVCAYRGDDENVCYIGALIKDEFYNKTFEGISVDLLAGKPIRDAVRKSLGISRISRKGRNFLGRLQQAHDKNVAKVDRTRTLRVVATAYDLKVPQ